MALRGLVTRFGLLGRQPVESRKMTGSTVPISTSTMQQVETKKINTSSTVASVYTDSHLDALDRRKRSRSHRSKEFDTLGTWDTRLNVAIDEAAMLKTGQVVPSIEAGMVGVATHEGRRSYQEDRYRVVQLRPDLLYIAVFDGHGGSLCAEYCEEHFERHILHHLDREEDMLVVLDKSFHDDNYTLHLGHCGDSRAILCRDNEARSLTKDHCASDPDEAARIKGSGGRVITDSIGRTMVNNRLAMSRSIGDLELKKYGVTARPELRSVRIKHGKDQFLAFTSDGINFVMRDEEVVDCINKCEGAKEGAARLVDQALLYSCEDNATAIVVPLGSWGKGDASSSMFYSFGRNMSNTSRFS